MLVPNLFYRAHRAPVFDASFDYANNLADREKYARTVASFLAPGAAERDAVAYIAFLDSQPQVNKKKKIGTHGYCLGGPYIMRTAAALPERVGAGASFHGGFLVTDKPNSPHLLAPKIKARLYFAIAADDDGKFKMTGIAPAKYKIFALEKLAAANYRSPEAADALKLTQEQSQQIQKMQMDAAKEIQTRTMKEMQGLFDLNGNPFASPLRADGHPFGAEIDERL